MEAIIAWSSHTEPANLSVSVSSESARSIISVVPGNRLPAIAAMGSGHQLTISVEELSNSGGKATLYLGARDGGGTLPQDHHHCFTVHAVGPRAHTRPAHVKLTDYYQPTLNDIQMYTIPEDCPSHVSHDTDTYQQTDNLFDKARSLDTGEILINNDFTFEDIPEGTPLEDPLFENLKEKKDNRNKQENYPANIVKDIIPDKNITKAKLNVKDNSIDYSAILNIFQSQINYINGEIKEINEIIKHKYKINNETSNEKLNAIARIKEDKREINTDRPKIDNPKLSSFHVIESEKDLEVPTGVEGPVPSVVLPPKDFVFNSTGPGTSETFWRSQLPTSDIDKNMRHERKINYA
ncbi:hypothetical protein RR48_13118 [Papilio machaon]|uniref:Uncharacterized protein n=1 Tax=Papilio machaon TaxID=76193 RepID=A0A194QVZ5_PAPMA|nr:hypothetical protein RR48_13118 [Papilio machaon]